MTIDRRIPEHRHFDRGTFLIAAVLVALFAIFTALLFIASGYLVSGLILASGAVIAGLLARRAAGPKAMWMCFGLGALAIIVGALLQLMMTTIG